MSNEAKHQRTGDNPDEFYADPKTTEQRAVEAYLIANQSALSVKLLDARHNETMSSQKAISDKVTELGKDVLVIQTNIKTILKIASYALTAFISAVVALVGVVGWAASKLYPLVIAILPHL